jgi:copper(I)-binding protein
MHTTGFRRLRKLTPSRFCTVTVSVLVFCGAFNALAQNTLPLPTPGTAPAAPAAPGAGGDNAAKARAAALAAKANVDITEAWTRASGNAMNAPVYLHIVSAKDADKLIGVEVSTADHVEFRDDQAGGRASPITPVDIPPGGTVNFAPGGRYLNLVGLKAPLKEGDSFILTLKFDKAGTSSTAVKVLGTGATGMPSASSARRADTTSGVSQR